MLATTAKSENPGAARGHARLVVEVVGGQSTVTGAYSVEPLKILVPKPRGQSAWACAGSFGGGLVAGDRTRLDVKLGPGAVCFISSQASTKIYRNPLHRPCSHETRAVIESGGILVFAPDAIQPFADSIYSQRQEFHLADGAGLVLLDWFGSGRAARGERWQCSRLHCRNEAFMAGQRVFLDSILLDQSGGPPSSPMRAGRFNCFAMLLLLGKPFGPMSTRLVANVSARPIERNLSLLSAASSLPHGAVLRVAGEEVEAVAREVRGHLALLADILGEDPWRRK
ncbi:MAG: urease accessory protein UreD [Verrucomicrobiota bacterium]|nr:urease accessory protein UreD [Verrucomicrobiota bacterium]